MNDLSNSLPPAGDDALEARIVAWVLGEASPFEAAELEKLCTENPHLRAFERRIRDLNELLAEDAKPGLHATWQLPAEKRGKVMDLLGGGVRVGAEQEAMRLVPDSSSDKVVRYFSRRSLLAAAACLAVSLVAFSMFGGFGDSRRAVAAKSAERGMQEIVASDEAYRAEQPSAEVAERRLDVLRSAVKAQEDKVEDTRKLLSSVIRSGKFVSDPADGGAGSSLADDATDATRNYAKLEQEKIQLEGQIETLTKYDGNQLYNYIGSLDLPDNVIPKILPEYQAARREYDAAKASGLGEQHPDLGEREKQLAAMEKDLSEAAVNLRESLKAKNELAKEQLARFESRMTLKKEDAVKNGLEVQNYVDAKQEFEAQQRHLEQLKMRLVSEEMDAKAGRQSLAANEAKRESNITEEVRYKNDSQDAALGRAENKASALAANDSKRRATAASSPATPPPSPAAMPMAPAGPARKPTSVIEGVGEVPPVAGDLLALQDGEPAKSDAMADGTKMEDVVTAGNRSGDGAINRNNLDAIIPGEMPSLAGSASGGIGGVGGGGGFGGGGAGPSGGRGLGVPETPAPDASITAAATAMPMKPGASFAGDKQLAESNKPMDAPLAKSKSEVTAQPASGPASGEDRRDSEIALKEAEVARKKDSAPLDIQTAATDRYNGEVMPGGRPQAPPAEPGLATNDSDAPATAFRRQEQVQGLADAKGGKSMWMMQDEGTKGLSAESAGLLADSANGGLKADLSLTLGDKSGARGGETERLGRVPEGGAGAAHFFSDLDGDRGAPANPQGEGKPGSNFRGYLASQPEAGQAAEHGKDLMGRDAFGANSTSEEAWRKDFASRELQPAKGKVTMDDDADGFSPLSEFKGQAAVTGVWNSKSPDPRVRPPGGMPTEMDLEKNAQDLNGALLGQAGSQQNRLGTYTGFDLGDLSADGAKGKPAWGEAAAAQYAFGFTNGATGQGTSNYYTTPSNGVADATMDFARPGQKAQGEIFREYATPELPMLLGSELHNAQAPGNSPVTPATPTNFDVPAQAGAGGEMSGLAQKEMYRRQSAVADADRLLIEGREAYSKEKYKEANDKYMEALGKLPEVPMTEDRRKVIEEHLSDSSTALADAYRRVGKYEEARALAENFVARDKGKDAKSGAGSPDDAIRNNPALTYEHTENVDKVRRSLYLAEGAYNLGKFDDANRYYEDAIRVDPTNKAARRGMEMVEQSRADYYRAAYDHTRARLLAEVDKSWESGVPPASDAEKTLPAAKEAAANSEVDFDKLRAGGYSPQDLAWSDPDNPAPGLPEAVTKPGENHRFNIEGNTKTADKVIRRELPLGLREADNLLIEGRDDYARSDYEGALTKYKTALEKLGDQASFGDRGRVIGGHIADAEVALAEQDLQAGKKDEAGRRLQAAFAFMPEHADAKLLKKRLDDSVAIGDEIAATTEAFSTFSLHVSDASFKMAKAALDRGEQPAAESIRPEEFYNAFDYGDAAPAQGEPVVCATEQCAHPAVPQRNLLRIGVRTAAAGRGASTPLNLTLLLDSSGSMERPDRQAAMTKAVAQLAGLLKEGDTVTVAGFARQPRLLADRLPGARAQELNQIIAQTPSEGGTNLEEGIKLAEELAKRQFNPAAQNRIVLFTDGAANLGDARPEALRGRVEQLRQQNIAFDAAGFGADGLNDRLLEQLTRNGNGRYYIVDRAEEAGDGFAKQLAGAFRPAAENVKVQVRFNPARVAHYKLIGFEEHRLKKEDFHNDAVDAAEMAAEEAGNALYQIEPLPGGEGQIGEVSVRFRDAASGQMVERTWTIPYEAQAPAFDRAKPSIQLAGLAAFAAEKLRHAPLSDALDFKELGKSFAAVKAQYPGSQPVSDLGGMIEKLK